jgi:hypothetical protein
MPCVWLKKHIQYYLKNSNGKSPDFIIAGAAKAGTSSLCDYLGQHSDIYMTQPKELNFFNRNREDRELDSYLKYFEGAENQIPGEGSVSYLHYSKFSAPQLKKHFPDLKLIFMLRILSRDITPISGLIFIGELSYIETTYLKMCFFRKYQ